MGRPAQEDEKILINTDACSSRKDFSTANVVEVLPSAPMPIGDALVDAFLAEPRESIHRARIRTAMHVLAVARGVLRDEGVDQQAHAAARRGLAKIEHLGVLRHLTGIINVADGTDFIPTDWRTELVKRINAFAEFLHKMGWLAPASDIYARAAQVRNVKSKVTMAAIQGRAWTLRQLGDHFRSERAYQQLRALAEAVGDTAMVLEADLGLSTIMTERGNLGDAETLTASVLEKAAGHPELREIVARAHGNMACIAGMRDRHDDVIVHSDAALNGPLSDIDHDICFANMAWAFRMIRDRRSAGRYARRVASDGEGIEQRTSALVTLCHLALDWDGSLSPRRADIDIARVSAAMRVDIYELDARTAYISGDEAMACRTLGRGITFAAEHKLFRAVMQFDTALGQIGEREMPKLFFAPTCVPAPERAGAVRTIATASRRIDAAPRRAGLLVRVHLAPATDDDITAAASAIPIGIGIVATGA